MTEFRNCFRERYPAALGLFLATVIGYIIIRLALSADQSSGANYIGSRVKPSLQLTVIVTRHGNRSPASTYPGFPYQANDTEYWPDGANELTLKGRNQMLNCGTKVRSMYNGFLDQLYFPKDFIAYSSPYKWTLGGGEIFLAALFPPEGFQVWNKNLLWQPVPVFDNKNDHTSYPPASENSVECPRFRRAQNISYLEFYSTGWGREMVRIMTDLAPYTGLTTVDMFHFFDLWSCIFIADTEGYPVPEWAKQYYPEPMTSTISNMLSAASTGSDVQIRLLQGLMFRDIVDVFWSKINGSNADQKMYYVSGHDITILGIEAILGVTSATVINPGSMLILELHRDSVSGRYYIEVLFIDGFTPDLEPVTLDVSGCEAPCDWYLLANMTAKYYNITDFQNECEDLNIN